MPARGLISKELATLFSVLAHPDRIRILEELRHGELDVNSIQATLGVTHSRTSQYLSILRANRLVIERREGRRVLYRLAQPELAAWITEGLRFIETQAHDAEDRLLAIAEVKHLWGGD